MVATWLMVFLKQDRLAEWYVREVDSGKDLTDHIRWVKFSGASWDKDDQGFYYSRYAQPSEEERLNKANSSQKALLS